MPIRKAAAASIAASEFPSSDNGRHYQGIVGRVHPVAYAVQGVSIARECQWLFASLGVRFDGGVCRAGVREATGSRCPRRDIPALADGRWRAFFTQELFVLLRELLEPRLPFRILEGMEIWSE